jgi:hypothetical protein
MHSAFLKKNIQSEIVSSLSLFTHHKWTPSLSTLFFKCFNDFFLLFIKPTASLASRLKKGGLCNLYVKMQDPSDSVSPLNTPSKESSVSFSDFASAQKIRLALAKSNFLSEARRFMDAFGQNGTLFEFMLLDISPFFAIKTGRIDWQNFGNVSAEIKADAATEVITSEALQDVYFYARKFVGALKGDIVFFVHDESSGVADVLAAEENGFNLKSTRDDLKLNVRVLELPIKRVNGASIQQMGQSYVKSEEVNDESGEITNSKQVGQGDSWQIMKPRAPAFATKFFVAFPVCDDSKTPQCDVGASRPAFFVKSKKATRLQGFTSPLYPRAYNVLGVNNDKIGFVYADESMASVFGEESIRLQGANSDPSVRVILRLKTQRAIYAGGEPIACHLNSYTLSYATTEKENLKISVIDTKTNTIRVFLIDRNFTLSGVKIYAERVLALAMLTAKIGAVLVHASGDVLALVFFENTTKGVTTLSVQKVLIKSKLSSLNAVQCSMAFTWRFITVALGNGEYFFADLTAAACQLPSPFSPTAVKSAAASAVKKRDPEKQSDEKIAEPRVSRAVEKPQNFSNSCDPEPGSELGFESGVGVVCLSVTSEAFKRDSTRVIFDESASYALIKDVRDKENARAMLVLARLRGYTDSVFDAHKKSQLKNRRDIVYIYNRIYSDEDVVIVKTEKDGTSKPKIDEDEDEDEDEEESEDDEDEEEDDDDVDEEGNLRGLIASEEEDEEIEENQKSKLRRQVVRKLLEPPVDLNDKSANFVFTKAGEVEKLIAGLKEKIKPVGTFDSWLQSQGNAKFFEYETQKFEDLRNQIKLVISVRELYGFDSPDSPDFSLEKSNALKSEPKNSSGTKTNQEFSERLKKIFDSSLKELL